MEIGRHWVCLARHAVNLDAGDFEGVRSQEIGQYVDRLEPTPAAGAKVQAKTGVLLLLARQVCELINMREIGELECMIAGDGMAAFIAIGRTQDRYAIVADAEEDSGPLSIQKLEVPKCAQFAAHLQKALGLVIGGIADIAEHD